MNEKRVEQRAKNNRKAFKNVLLIIFALIFVVFLGDFASIAITGQAKGQNLASKTKFKYTRKNPLLAKRGDIYDAEGNEIASDSGEFSMYAILDKNNKDKKGKPNYVKDKKETAKILSDILDVKEKKIYKFLNVDSSKVFQVEFGSYGKKLSLHTKNKIESKKLPGIGFIKTPSRSYPNGTFATNVVGITAIKNKNAATYLQKNTGIMGIEKEFNKDLQGQDGVKISKVDSKGVELPETKVITKQAKNGKDLYLTIDTKLQDYVEVLMSQVQKKYNPKSLQAIVMDTKTGQIKAISQRPSFDPATLKGIDKSWRNILVEDQYEPGSIMKIVSLATAIDTGVYDPKEKYMSGMVQVDDRIIRDWNHVGWGNIPFSQAFPRSSNVGMVHLEEKIGGKRWKKYLNKFQFGKKTGIEMPGEVSGKIQFERKSDRAMTSFGQSINVNTIQLMQAISAVANDGKMIKPYIVEKVVDPDTGKETSTKSKIVGNPIKASTAKKVRKAMIDVVEKEYGTGTVYKIPGYKIAVKTGTAQIASPAGGYLTGDSNYIFSVMGLLPADKPRYQVYVAMKQPQNMSEQAEKIVSEIFNPLSLRLLKSDRKIKSSIAINKNSYKLKDFSNQETDKVKKELDKKHIEPIIIGSGNKVVQQLPKGGQTVLHDQRVLIMTNGAMTMPDVRGWSKNDVLKLSEITGKKIEITGSGYVKSQSVKAGEILNDKKDIIIKLKR